MTTSPLLFVWGDDDLRIDREIERFATALAADGLPLERWELRGQRAGAIDQIATLRERVGTPVMFGGGTLAVVSNPGPLLAAAGGRKAMGRAIEQMAPGNAIAFVDVPHRKEKGSPAQKAFAATVEKSGGRVRPVPSLRGSALGGWIAKEASERGLALGPGAAAELAKRIGGAVNEGDVDRRFWTRTALTELDKLALYRESGPVTVDDIRTLVAETVPPTIFGLTDAVGRRQTARALADLERLFDDATPEPVIVMVLHRRIRDILEVKDRFARGQKPAEVVTATHLHSYVVQMAQESAPAWTTDELAAALAGLVELDAMAKGAPGTSADAKQRRMAFTLWVIDHTTRRPGTAPTHR